MEKYKNVAIRGFEEEIPLPKPVERVKKPMEQILEFIGEKGIATASAITEALGGTVDNRRHRLQSYKENGLIVGETSPKGGLNWHLTEKGKTFVKKLGERER